MRSQLLLMCALSCLPACVEQEIIGALTDPPVRASGQISVAMNDGSVLAVPGIAAGRKEPLVVEGTSSEMTFALIAAEDTSGSTAHAILAEPSRSVELVMTDGGNNLVEVHRDGTGCVARTGSVRLELGADSRLSGSFDVAGTVWGGTTPCTLEGTLDGVPLDRDR